MCSDSCRGRCCICVARECICPPNSTSQHVVLSNGCPGRHHNAKTSPPWCLHELRRLRGRRSSLSACLAPNDAPSAPALPLQCTLRGLHFTLLTLSWVLSGEMQCITSWILSHYGWVTDACWVLVLLTAHIRICSDIFAQWRPSWRRCIHGVW